MCLYLWKHWISHRKWFIYRIKPFKNWLHFLRSISNLSKNWISYHRLSILIIRNTFKNWIHFQRNLCSLRSNWRLFHNWMIFTRLIRNSSKNWVHVERNLWSCQNIEEHIENKLFLVGIPSEIDFILKEVFAATKILKIISQINYFY
jgi:hypothetical protein